VDFLLTAKRDREAALRFLRKAIDQNGTPEKITMDKSGANTAAIESHNAEHEAGIEIRQAKSGRPMRRIEKNRWLWQLAHYTTNVGRLRGDGDAQERGSFTTSTVATYKRRPPSSSTSSEWSPEIPDLRHWLVLRQRLQHVVMLPIWTRSARSSIMKTLLCGNRAGLPAFAD
jgi:hypothetical protein